MHYRLTTRERESVETETQRVIKWCLKVGDLVGRWKKLAKIDGLPQPTLNRKDCNDWVFCCQILVVGGTLEDVQGNTGRHPTPKIQKRRQKNQFTERVLHRQKFWFSGCCCCPHLKVIQLVPTRNLNFGKCRLTQLLLLQQSALVAAEISSRLI